MDVSTINIYLTRDDEISQVSDFKLIGFSSDNYFIFSYMYKNKLHYKMHGQRSHETYICLEYLNGFPLWNIKYDSTNYTSVYNRPETKLTCTFSIDITLISEFLNTSMALKHIISEIYNKLPYFTNTDLTNKSLLPSNSLGQFDVSKLANFKLKLYDYQKNTLNKMLQIENNELESFFNYTSNIDYHGHKINVALDLIF